MSRPDRLILVDTSAYLAAANRDDENNSAAATVLSELVSSGRRLITTTYVLAEIHAMMLTHVGRRAALVTLIEIRAS